jgi:hypothetical protein
MSLNYALLIPPFWRELGEVVKKWIIAVKYKRITLLNDYTV